MDTRNLTRRATLDDVAALAQVSPKTVSRVVNGDGPCNKERMHDRVKAFEDGRWVREAASAHAAKKARAAIARAAEEVVQ